MFLVFRGARFWTDQASELILHLAILGSKDFLNVFPLELTTKYANHVVNINPRIQRLSVALSDLLNTIGVQIVDAEVNENEIDLQAEHTQHSPSTQMWKTVSRVQL